MPLILINSVGNTEMNIATLKIKEIKKKSKLLSKTKEQYKIVLRQVRELALPHKEYEKYKENCILFKCSKLTENLPGLIDFQDKPFKSYHNKKLSKRGKFKIANGALLFIEENLKESELVEIYNIKNHGRKLLDIPLKNEKFLEINLMASPFQEEGELMLAMFLDGKKIYSICFSCTNYGAAYIGGLQGGKEFTAIDIKNITKELQGIRPKNMIISLGYMFFNFFNIKEIFAIDHNHHVKSDKIKSNYAELWSSLGGQPDNKGWYRLPCNEMEKSLEEIKSKHRSQYLKRQAIRTNAKMLMEKELLLIAKA